MIKKIVYCIFGAMLLLFAFLGVILYLSFPFEGNAIYFDMERQTISSCNKKPIAITRLWLSDTASKEFAYITCLHDEKQNDKCTGHFNLNEISEGYSVTVNLIHQIRPLKFKLSPDSEYEITHTSVPDASCYILIIRTDENGRVIYADRTSCDSGRRRNRTRWFQRFLYGLGLTDHLE